MGLRNWGWQECALGVKRRGGESDAAEALNAKKRCDQCRSCRRRWVLEKKHSALDLVALSPAFYLWWYRLVVQSHGPMTCGNVLRVYMKDATASQTCTGYV